jgi:DNA-binding transcriptional MerR regulator/methylmalonyl-CoA mutase cobalamin-binding subunit
MRVVTRKTGLTPDLLRAWEKRYNVVAPTRSGGGQRLYSTEDVERLALLKHATDRGRNIGQIAHLSPAELRDLIREDQPTGATVGIVVRQECMGAIERMDDAGLETVLRRAALNLSLQALTDYIVAPLTIEIGSRWHAGTLQPSQEHLATAIIRRVLFWAASTADPGPNAPTLVVSTPSGQRHELGALLAMTTAAASGWRVVYLGPDLPAADLADAVTRTGATVLALSLVYPGDNPATADELLALRKHLGPAVTIIAGGGAVNAYGRTLDEIGAIRCANMEALRTALTTLAPIAS